MTQSTEPLQCGNGTARFAKMEGIESYDLYPGTTVLRKPGQQAYRRVLYVNSYGGASVLAKIERGEMPGQHLWGCLELARMGYEVAIAPPLRHFSFRSRPLPHDLIYLRLARDWLGAEGIIYSAHTLLYWIPLLRALGRVRAPIVSLTYACEDLDWPRLHAGIIAMTPAAERKARKMAPKAKIARLSWGVDLSFFPKPTYAPGYFLSCGITRRDFGALSKAASAATHPVKVICPGRPENVTWPDNVTIIDGGSGYNFVNKAVSYRELLDEHYSSASAILVVIQADGEQSTANGFTNVLEAMAMGRPIIMTKTGAVPGEIDLEKSGCGLFVPPGDSRALADAMDQIAMDSAAADLMGQRGRSLCEQHYNMERFGAELHGFFDSL
jgi:glycosyltransferase involved in cell wall biosynthesis